MAQPPASAVKETADTIIPAKPFAQAIHPLLRAKPEPEKFKSQSLLFNEDRCGTCMDILCDDKALPQQKIKAAFELGGLVGKIKDEDIIKNAAYVLRGVMVDGSEHPPVRMACAVSLGSSGYKGLAGEMEKEVLKANTHVNSKILALKALSICRSDEAIELLGTEARYGKVDEACIAAAKELAGIPLCSKAREMVEGVISNPPEAYLRNPEAVAELRRLMGVRYLIGN